MDRPARGFGDAAGDGTVVRRSYIRAPNPGVRRRETASGQVYEPVGSWVRVVVDVGDDLPAGRRQTRVAGAAQAALLRADKADAELAGDGCSIVGRPVVNHEHIEIWILQVAQATKTLAQCPRAVVGADDHGDARPRGLGERARDRLQRWFGGAVAACQAECPVVDVGAAPEPLVGPGKDEPASAA